MRGDHEQDAMPHAQIKPTEDDCAPFANMADRKLAESLAQGAAEMRVRMADMNSRRAEFERRHAEFVAEHPGLESEIEGRWQANPTGLSGRLIRGYRHWRYKR
jgi:hypothetical protein